MKLDVVLVPTGHVHEVYPHIVAYVKKAQEWTLGRMSTDNISATLFNPNVLVWIVVDESNCIHGYLSTEIRTYPQTREFCVLNCGGMDGSLEACVDKVFDTFEQYARDSGCDGLEIIGRPAWAKFVRERGYDMPQRQYFKSLKE